jgi:hypothetical protein
MRSCSSTSTLRIIRKLRFGQLLASVQYEDVQFVVKLAAKEMPKALHKNGPFGR